MLPLYELPEQYRLIGALPMESAEAADRFALEFEELREDVTTKALTAAKDALRHFVMRCPSPRRHDGTRRGRELDLRDDGEHGNDRPEYFFNYETGYRPSPAHGKSEWCLHAP